MRTTLISLLLICAVICDLSAQDVANQTSRSGGGMPYLEYLPEGYSSSDRTYPTMIFLHGAGERGSGGSDLQKVALNGPPKHIRDGHKMNFTIGSVTDTFIVISPQLESGDWWSARVEKIVDYTLENYRVDTCRFYLTGLSLGGGGTWGFACSSKNDENSIAAILSVAGWGSKACGCKAAERNIPVWAIHGQNDSSVPVEDEIKAVESYNECLEPLEQDSATMTIYPDVGHHSWRRAFTTDNTYHDPNPYQWLLTQNKCEEDIITGNNPVIPDLDIKIYPIPVAGEKITVEFPDYSSPVQLKVTDSSGKEFFNKYNISAREDISAPAAKGVYFFSFYSSGNLIAQRTIVK